MSFHTIVIVGHLGREPEIRYTPSGQAVTNFNLAANRQYTDARWPGSQGNDLVQGSRAGARGRELRGISAHRQPGAGRRPADLRPGDGRPAALQPPGRHAQRVLRGQRFARCASYPTGRRKPSRSRLKGLEVKCPSKSSAALNHPHGEGHGISGVSFARFSHGYRT